MYEEIYLKELLNTIMGDDRSEICGQTGRLETLAGGDNGSLEAELSFGLKNTIPLEWITECYQESDRRNVDSSNENNLLNYFSFKGNHCSQFHRWLDNILYGLIPRMVEEIHLFQNVIIIIIIILVHLSLMLKFHN